MTEALAHPELIAVLTALTDDAPEVRGAVLASVVVLESAYLRSGATVGGVLCRRASEGAAAAKIQHLQWAVCAAVEHGSVREVGAC